MTTWILRGQQSFGIVRGAWCPSFFFPKDRPLVRSEEVKYTTLIIGLGVWH
jgi:hypothetical protein